MKSVNIIYFLHMFDVVRGIKHARDNKKAFKTCYVKQVYYVSAVYIISSYSEVFFCYELFLIILVLVHLGLK